jgi:predicted MFS family arabinose efflux permease
MLVFVPILFKGMAVVWMAILFAVLRDAFNNFGFPAWMSNTNAIVPIDGRGRYFGSRNFIMSITGMAATLITGKLITLFVKPVGYQIALAMAFVIGMASSFSFSRITDVTARPPAEKAHGFPLRGLGKTILAQPQFIAFTLTAALWNFSIYITGPFFNVQMVNVLHFSAATIGFLSVVTSFAVMITQRRVGALDDRVGSRRLQLISMFLIPVLPLAWIFVTAAWQVVIINLLSGLFWGIFNLATFNLLLASIPHDQVPRFSAVYQIVVMVAMALGAAVGSAIINLWGFFGVLIASTVMRVVSAVVFSRTVHEPQKSVQAE